MVRRLVIDSAGPRVEWPGYDEEYGNLELVRHFLAWPERIEILGLRYLEPGQ